MEDNKRETYLAEQPNLEPTLGEKHDCHYVCCKTFDVVSKVEKGSSLFHLQATWKPSAGGRVCWQQDRPQIDSIQQVEESSKAQTQTKQVKSRETRDHKDSFLTKHYKTL